MSAKINIILVFVLTLVYTKAQGNELCPCDPKDNSEEKKLLSILLEKLSSHVKKDEESLFSVYPGLLNEFACDCAEKQRRKRKIMPEAPVEVSQDASETDPEEPVVIKRSIHKRDRRCPEGSYRFARQCVKAHLLEDY